MIKDEFEAFLAGFLENDNLVTDAMNYALTGAGKRLRPLLLLNALTDYGIDYKEGFTAASALEMVHTYSLIHDDLPAMDNDDLRRGRKTVHKQYDEATAILAGDGLLTKAFEILAKSSYPAEVRSDLVCYLADYSGDHGMILGQCMDMDFSSRDDVTLNELEAMEAYKTGKLLTLPFIMASIIAGRKQNIETLITVGRKLGLAFQIQDDVLDYVAGEKIMGKSTSDKENNKVTYYTLLGEQKAVDYCNTLYDEVMELLDSLDCEFRETKALISYMRNRKY